MTDKDRLLKVAVANFICLQEGQTCDEVYEYLRLSRHSANLEVTPVEIYENWSNIQLLNSIDDFHKTLIKTYNLGAHQGCLHKIIM